MSQDERLAEIRARVAKASSGPWEALRVDDDPDKCDGIIPQGARRYGGREIVTTDCGVYGPKWPDADFIAHAREDVPFLLDLIEALTRAS